ncbi:nitroreductase [Chloroherpeton thalassium ATCC 35110]|uniref:Nitroreductase n=1 Tax=Chloroherpeton thalassium (strain ATCC 35110 / GB-78) TaxID=517418 RepID=B3QUT5_CHLT3|nr:nitroreductase family protein [Chloroherpeton thalassium]ACF14436.1 nitroreductase [Chloroherpeton thalassium ATCC 35110]
MEENDFLPLSDYQEYSVEEMIRRSGEFFAMARKRRSIRNFSSKPVPHEVIENCVRAAGTAPSGANLQPWKFVVVSNPEIKQKIREGAEKEEEIFYYRWAPNKWLDALTPFGTSGSKPFLTKAPYLIVVFAEMYGVTEDGEKMKHYYVEESVGIATGLLITALHHAGLVSLTHTPSPMDFLNKLLGRPDNERPVMILVVGYPDKNAVVPNIERKSLSEIATFYK